MYDKTEYKGILLSNNQKGVKLNHQRESAASGEAAAAEKPRIRVPKENLNKRKETWLTIM